MDNGAQPEKVISGWTPNIIVSLLHGTGSARQGALSVVYSLFLANISCTSIFALECLPKILDKKACR